MNGFVQELALQCTAKHYTAVALFLLLALFAPSGPAQESTPVEDALVRLEKALEHEQALASETKEALQAVIRALHAERTQSSAPHHQVDKGEIAKVVDEYLTASPPAQEETPLESFFDRLSMYGDFRLRNEFDANRDSAKDRYRARIRLRLGVNYQLTDTLQFGARIVTGDSDDSNSTHQTLGTVFDSSEISLDRAFLTWRPEWVRNGWGTVGKFSHPFYANPVYGELVWDADIQPEGAAIGYKITDRGWLEQFDLVLGEYIVLEQGSADDAYATVAQVSARLHLRDTLKVNVALGYYRYNDATPDGSLLILGGDNAGNAVVDRNLDGITDGFASEFEILNPIIALTYDGGLWPLTLSGEYIKNFDADIDKDEGWALGISLGDTKKKGDWKFYYQWQVVQQDSLFSAVAQDDFLLATNHRTHLFGVNYQLTDKIQAHLRAMASESDQTRLFATGGSDKTQLRLRLDLDAKF